MKPTFFGPSPSTRSYLDVIKGASTNMWNQRKVPVPIPDGGWSKWNAWQKVGVVGLGASVALLVVGAIVHAVRS